MNDRWCRESRTCFRRSRTWLVGDERHDYELQSNQSAGGGADNYIEAIPLCELLHDGLFFQPFKPVRQLRALISLVRELGNKQRKRLGISCDSKWTAIHRLKTDVIDQSDGDIFCASLVAAIHQTRPRLPALSFEYTEEHLAGNRVEGAHHMRFRNPLRKLFRTRGRICDEKFRVLLIHRQ